MNQAREMDAITETPPLHVPLHVVSKSRDIRDSETQESTLNTELPRKRTRTGCLTCGKRRIKCDEERPECRNCSKTKRGCKGYTQHSVFKYTSGSPSTPILTTRKLARSVSPVYLPTPLNTPPKRCHQASTPLAVADPEAIARIEGPEFSPADGPLKKRKSSKDQSDEEFECKHEGCDRNFLRAADLHRHQLDHTPIQMRLCDFPGCSRSFLSFSRQDHCSRHRERPQLFHEILTPEPAGGTEAVENEDTRSCIPDTLPSQSTFEVCLNTSNPERTPSPDSTYDSYYPLRAHPPPIHLEAYLSHDQENNVPRSSHGELDDPSLTLTVDNREDGSESELGTSSEGSLCSWTDNSEITVVDGDTGALFPLVRTRFLRMFFENFDNQRSSFRSHAANGNQTQSNDNGGNSTDLNSSTTINHNGKRPAENRSNRSPNEDERNNKRRQTRTRSASSQSADVRLLACPFYKYDRRLYRKCSACILREISRLKQHLDRNHRIPIHCASCFTTFKSEDERDDHTRQRSCSVLPPMTFDGVNEKQRRQLKKRCSPLKTREENWYLIYDILFPGSSRPDNPYLDEALSVELLAFQDFCFTEAPGILNRIIAQELPESLQSQEEEVQRMAQVAFQDGLKVILERWEARIPPAESQGSDASHQPSSPPLPTPLKTPPTTDHHDTRWVNRDVSPTPRLRELPSPPDTGPRSAPRTRHIEDAVTQVGRALQFSIPSPNVRQSAGFQTAGHQALESLDTPPTLGDSSFDFNDDALLEDFHDDVLFGGFLDGHERPLET